MTTETPLYRKKPVIIQASQWFCKGHCPAWAQHAVTEYAEKFCIDTLEGVMIGNPGDWIIKGVKGEIYPCKPDIFAMTYERAATPPAPVYVGLDDDNKPITIYAKDKDVVEVAARTIKEQTDKLNGGYIDPPYDDGEEIIIAQAVLQALNYTAIVRERDELLRENEAMWVFSEGIISAMRRIPPNSLTADMEPFIVAIEKLAACMQSYSAKAQGESNK